MNRSNVYNTISLNGTHTEGEELLDVLENIGEGARLILYNDDFNTFEWVIKCLMKYCKHTAEQAEQCAWIVHNNGKCHVKSGTMAELEPICTALCDAGLSAVIE